MLVRYGLGNEPPGHQDTSGCWWIYNDMREHPKDSSSTWVFHSGSHHLTLLPPPATASTTVILRWHESLLLPRRCIEYSTPIGSCVREELLDQCRPRDDSRATGKLTKVNIYMCLPTVHLVSSDQEQRYIPATCTSGSEGCGKVMFRSMLGRRAMQTYHVGSTRCMRRSISRLCP